MTSDANKPLDSVSSIAADIQGVSRSEIAEVVKSCLGDKNAKPISWRAEPLAASSIGNGTLGFFTVSGQAKSDSETVKWSSVVKAMEPAPAFTSGSFNNPKREIDAYRSGFFAQIDTGIIPAPCYLITDRPDGSVWLWLRDLATSIQPPYDLPVFLNVQQDTGRFNGEWPESRVPDYEWLPTDGSNLRIPSSRQVLLEHRIEHGDLADAPLMLIASKGIGRDGWLTLGDSLAEIEKAVVQFPQALAHNDWHAWNLMPVESNTGDRVTYGIDWASIGLAPIGIDGGGLVGSSLTRGNDEAEMMLRHEADFFAAYMEGLRKADWKGSRDEIRVAYLAEIVDYLTNFELVIRHLSIGSNFTEFFHKRFGCGDREIAEQTNERLVAAYHLVDEAIEIAQKL